MPRKSKKYHFVYKTTNTVNGKYYVGMHSTDYLEDGYIGSGKKLWNSIRKYGRDKFVIERIEFFETRELLVEREKALVNEDLLKDPMCMNLMKGGEGGFISEEQQRKRSIAAGLAKAKRLKEDFVMLSELKECAANNFKSAHINGKIKYDTFTGRTHAQKTKDEIGYKNSINQTGNKNSQFGTCWICKNNINKKIKLNELDSFLLQGWIKGRRGHRLDG